jgi:folylpolyglutamate synthase/dihydrofolate synthase
MNAQEVIERIHAARFSGEKAALNNTKALFEKLNIAPDAVPAIHVAGTNGKGSVCAMLESALRQAGYKTGLYTSPFLQVYNERIAINGKAVTDDILAAYGTRVLEAAEGIRATAFELGTALAMLIFKEEKVDMAIVEVGLGGRLDPTNVILPKISVITAIGLDHMEILGDTIEKIAAEKAGIIKPGVPVVLQPCSDNVYEVISRFGPAMRLNESMIANVSGDKRGFTAELNGIKVCIPLPGKHQLLNALTAVMVLKQLGMSEHDIKAGIANTVWPARLEYAGNVLIDGAHNAQGVKALKEYVEEYLSGERIVLLTGVLSDKMTFEMAEGLKDITDTVVTVTPDNFKAIPATELKKHFKNAVASDSVKQGLETACALAGEDGLVIAAGSLYLAGEIRSILGLKHR